MESFRDYDDEVKLLIDKLGAANPKELTAIDIGCGTGAFAIHAAKYLKKVYAVDVSENMLNIAKSKAESRGIDNIEFCNSGFLQFQVSSKVDVVISKWAFHHLPDYWKQVALLNINGLLKMDGIFLLTDLVFTFDPDYEKPVEAMINGLSNALGKDLINETKIHIRDEYSTFDWILHGLIKRAGFRIEKLNAENSLASEYLCRKIRSSDHGIFPLAPIATTKKDSQL